MGGLYKKRCNIVIKVAVFCLTFIKIISSSVPIIDTDGFTVNGSYTGQTMITLHFSCPLIHLNEPLIRLHIINCLSKMNLYVQEYCMN